MKQGTFLGLMVLALSLWGATSAGAQAKEAAGKRRLFVNGTQIPTNRMLSKDGVDYVDVAAIADAIGAKLDVTDIGIRVTSAGAKGDCEKLSVEGRRFSPEFRTDVLAVPDEIESLRAVVAKKESAPLGPRFDDIDRKLNLSTAHVQTDADQAVYYALSYANNSLAIAYYKQSRGVPVDEAQKDQLDSVICSMESKFALMKGVLIPGGTCSVLKRIEGQASSPKSDETAKDGVPKENE